MVGRGHKYVEESQELADGARALVERCVDTAKLLRSVDEPDPELVSGGRKAHRLRMLAEGPNPGRSAG